MHHRDAINIEIDAPRGVFFVLVFVDCLRERGDQTLAQVCVGLGPSQAHDERIAIATRLEHNGVAEVLFEELGEVFDLQVVLCQPVSELREAVGGLLANQVDDSSKRRIVQAAPDRAWSDCGTPRRTSFRRECAQPRPSRQAGIGAMAADRPRSPEHVRLPRRQAGRQAAGNGEVSFIGLSHQWCLAVLEFVASSPC